MNIGKNARKDAAFRFIRRGAKNVWMKLHYAVAGMAVAIALAALIVARDLGMLHHLL